MLTSDGNGNEEKSKRDSKSFDSNFSLIANYGIGAVVAGNLRIRTPVLMSMSMCGPHDSVDSAAISGPPSPLQPLPHLRMSLTPPRIRPPRPPATPMEFEAFIVDHVASWNSNIS